MPHGLDHIVHAIRDLDAAAEFYARAGFTVGARNRHAWGTHNRIVAQTEALLRQNGIGSQRHVGRLVVSPHVAHGATLIFETAKEG
jgi:Glyoxalase-like domain